MSSLADRAGHRAGRAALVALGTALTCVVWWLAAPGTAQAHPLLTRSTPADGQTVRSAPHEIQLWFSEPIDAASFRAQVYDDQGRLVLTAGRSAPRVPEASVSSRDGDSHVVLSPLPRLPRSVYEVRWSVVSRVDLHRLQGGVTFGVGRIATSGRASAGGPPGATPSILGWLDLLGSALLFGGVLLGVGLVPWVRRRGPATADLAAALGPLVQRVVLLAVLGGFISLVASASRLVQQAGVAATERSTWDLLVSSGQGGRWALRALALVVLLALLVRVGRRGAGGAARRADLVLPVLAATEVALRASTSHAQGGAASLAVLSVHELAALTWVGGVVVLVPVTLGLLGRPGGRLLARRLLAGFGLVAASCVTVVVMTGLLLAGRQVATVDAALRSAYGWTLFAKTGLVGAAMLLGLGHARRLHPWLPGGGRSGQDVIPRRSLGLEAGIGALVLAAAAMLSGTEPARGPQFSPAPVANGQVSSQSDGMLVTVALRPNRPGRNLVMVDVHDQRRPSPGRVDSVSVATGGWTARATRLRPTRVDADGNGRWQATVDVAASGSVASAPRIGRAGLDPTTVRGSWTVPSGQPSRPVAVSDDPLAPWADTGAGGVAALGLLATAVLVRRRRRHAALAAPLPGQPPVPALVPTGNAEARL